jgi:hypothetical protein
MREQIQILDRSDLIGRQEDLSDYVAHLQLHMALQARNLVPSLGGDRFSNDSRSQLLQQTQADFEKFASRQ